MAITIQTAPSNTGSVNDEMLFVVVDIVKASDDVTYPDYRYVCDIYVNDIFAARLKARPDPLYKMGVFNVGPILRSYQSYNFPAGFFDYNVLLNYKVKFGEEYGDTIYTNLLVDSSDRETYQTYKPKPFFNSNVIANGRASNMPDTVYQYRPLYYHLIPFFSNVSGVPDLQVDAYNAAGTLVSASTISNAGYSAKEIRQFNLGGSPINNAALDISYAILSGTFDLRINYICSKYTPVVLAWLNPYGAYETQHFGLLSKKNIEISHKEFSQLDYRWNSSGVVSYGVNNTFYGGKKTFSSNVIQRMKITSHLLNDAEYTWLADLFISPDVYIYDPGTTYFQPVRIIETNYEYRTYKNSKKTPLEFSVEFAAQYNSQFL